MNKVTMNKEETTGLLRTFKGNNNPGYNGDDLVWEGKCLTWKFKDEVFISPHSGEDCASRWSSLHKGQKPWDNQWTLGWCTNSADAEASEGRLKHHRGPKSIVNKALMYWPTSGSIVRCLLFIMMVASL